MPDERKIKRSRIHCNDCDTTIESTHRHDFVSCRCGNVFLDGGISYIRYGFKDDADFEVLTDYEED